MPKQQINYPDVNEYYTVDEPGDGGPVGLRFKPYEGGPLPEGHKVRQETALHLHWEEDTHFQVSLEIDLASLQEYVRMVSEGDDPPKTVSFYTPALNRRETQKLISTARRARNAVFGADE